MRVTSWVRAIKNSQHPKRWQQMPKSAVAPHCRVAGQLELPQPPNEETKKGRREGMGRESKQNHWIAKHCHHLTIFTYSILTTLQGVQKRRSEAH